MKSSSWLQGFSAEMAGFHFIFLLNKILLEAPAHYQNIPTGKIFQYILNLFLQRYNSIEFYPIQAEILTNFIAFLTYQNYAQPTIATYVSALFFF